LVLVATVFVAVLASSMVNVALPVIGEEFKAPDGQVGWVVTGNLLALAVCTPLAGRASDVFGLRRVFLLGLVAFALGSLVCALAPAVSLAVLILGRVLQGAGEGTLPALAAVAVTRQFPEGERGGALGLVFAGAGVGIALGPIVGGVTDQLLGWRALFWGVLVAAALLLSIAPRVLPKPEPSGDPEDRYFDALGGVLFALAAGLLLFGVTRGQETGFASPSSWGCVAGAVLSAALFAWRIGAAPRPFVPPTLFRRRDFSTAAAVGFCAQMANVTTLVLVPLLLSREAGLSSGTTALVLTPGPVALALLSPLAGRLSDRFGPKRPVLAGLSAMVVSLLFLSAYGAGGPLWAVAAGVLGLGAGFAFVNAPAINAAAASSGEAAGSALGIYQGLYFLGGAVGPALFGSLLAARTAAGSEAINPLRPASLAAAPFSDVFLLVAAPVLIVLAAALLGLGGEPRGGAPVRRG